MDTGDAKQRERLAEAVKRRRRQLGITQVDVTKAGGPSKSTQFQLETAQAKAFLDAGVARHEQVLGWAPGSFEAIMAGERPTLLTDDMSAPVAVAPSNVRSVGNLSQGRARTVSIDGWTATFTPRADATPEQIRRFEEKMLTDLLDIARESPA